eukprot:Phypoly_transcript_12156.p1 GENE.Phypoly_transcript_12156~~Phypoly_transcript_12156.p1  ORF type:complete len:322 (+),score=43.44 Phypoly_transcript_12156:58-966(+)
MNLYEKCDKLFYGHTGWIYAVCCDPGGAPFSGSNDNTIRSWDLEYVQCDHVFIGHDSRVASLVSPARGVVYSGSWDASLRGWDSRTGKETQNLKGHIAEVHGVSYDNGTICSVSNDQNIIIWDEKTWQIRAKENPGFGSISCCSLVNGWVYVGGKAGSLHAIDFENRKESKQLEDLLFGDGTEDESGAKKFVGLYSDVNSVVVHESTLFCGTEDGNVVSWDVNTGEMKHRFKGHSGSVTCLRAVGSSLFSGSTDGSIRMWDIESKECKRIYERNSMRVFAIDVSQDNLYNGCDEEVLRSWKL